MIQSRESLELHASVALQTGPLYTESRTRLKKEGDCSSSVDGRCNKQRHLLKWLVLGDCMISRSLHLPTRILKVYVEAFTGFSHIFSQDGFNNTLPS